MVTVLLANARPACIGSTVTSSGSSYDAPRANTVWIVLTVLPSWPSAPATIICPSSCPPNTTLWPVPACCAR